MNPEFLLAFVFVFAAVAVAVPQATTAATDFPGCAYACINTMMSVTACGINDIKCQCADLEALRFTYQCIANACSTADFNSSSPSALPPPLRTSCRCRWRYRNYSF
ncbi:hypothetical protein BZA05DRAFT_386312 [Tricharina praecox]|uniref:uncharacterized protein n=1 Tax=Tricharina praecox TaxID=43433 RepID=UPI00221EAA1E|nr:uncharacterized protein BZA05DRAFT_386312 [Tricharina praecox]KAI5856827.1 hypothetical protein BZA05DRAFT_386312 [Tricharina praecox]